MIKLNVWWSMLWPFLRRPCSGKSWPSSAGRRLLSSRFNDMAWWSGGKRWGCANCNLPPISWGRRNTGSRCSLCHKQCSQLLMLPQTILLFLHFQIYGWEILFHQPFFTFSHCRSCTAHVLNLHCCVSLNYAVAAAAHKCIFFGGTPMMHWREKMQPPMKSDAVKAKEGG